MKFPRFSRKKHQPLRLELRTEGIVEKIRGYTLGSPPVAVCSATPTTGDLVSDLVHNSSLLPQILARISDVPVDDAHQTALEHAQSSAPLGELSVANHTHGTDLLHLHAWWWGFEIYIPRSAMANVDEADKQSKTICALLGALAVGPLAPVKPFIGFINAYLSMEFDQIRRVGGQDGVVVAGLWVLPGLLAPREWVND